MDSKCWWNGNFEISSRNWEHEAIEEIDEKNGKSQNNIIFTWSKEIRKTLNQEILRTDLILIGTDASSSAFLDIQHPDKVLIGSIVIPEISQSGNALRASINDNSCNIYRSSTRIIVLFQYERSVSCESLFWWTNELFQHIQANSDKNNQSGKSEYTLPMSIKVVVFDTISEHKISMTLEDGPESKLIVPQLRYLSNGFQSDSILRLEAPHIVQHLAASVLTYCQIHKIQAILFLSLSNHHFMGAETLKELEKSLELIDVKHEILGQELYEDKLSKLKTRAKNSLYI